MWLPPLPSLKGTPMVQGQTLADGTTDEAINTQNVSFTNCSFYAPDADIDVSIGGMKPFTIPGGATFTATDHHPTSFINIVRTLTTPVYIYWW